LSNNVHCTATASAGNSDSGARYARVWIKGDNAIEVSRETALLSRERHAITVGASVSSGRRRDNDVSVWLICAFVLHLYGWDALDFATHGGRLALGLSNSGEQDDRAQSQNLDTFSHLTIPGETWTTYALSSWTDGLRTPFSVLIGGPLCHAYHQLHDTLTFVTSAPLTNPDPLVTTHVCLLGCDVIVIE